MENGGPATLAVRGEQANGSKRDSNDHFPKGKREFRSSHEDRPNVRISTVPKAVEGELIAAGWPSWLTAVASEAIHGWVPRRADTFEKIEKIGEGIYSNVYKVRDLLNGRIFALKRVRFDHLEPESVKFMAREILILRRLEHPNVIKLEGLVTSRMSCSLYLVLEHMEHDLTGIASLPGVKFTEPQVKRYMHQLLTGLEYCHSRGVLHRDIKCSNLLLDNHGILKIADFGLSTFYDNLQNVALTSRVVTLWYRPPELLLGETHYGVAVDLWSTGCVLGELYAGKPIITGKTEVEQLYRIFKLCGSPSDDFWRKSKLPTASIYKPHLPYRSYLAETFKYISPTAFDLLVKLLSFDPEQRGTATSALQSEFFRTEPLACDLSSLPTYSASLTLREKEAYRLRVKGAPQRRDYDISLASDFYAGLTASMEKPVSSSNILLDGSVELLKGYEDLQDDVHQARQLTKKVAKMHKAQSDQKTGAARRREMKLRAGKSCVQVSEIETEMVRASNSWVPVTQIKTEMKVGADRFQAPVSETKANLAPSNNKVHLLKTFEPLKEYKELQDFVQPARCLTNKEVKMPKVHYHQKTDAAQRRLEKVIADTIQAPVSETKTSRAYYGPLLVPSNNKEHDHRIHKVAEEGIAENIMERSIDPENAAQVYSGPQTISSYSVDLLLEEHDRQIQESAEKMRHERRRAIKIQAQESQVKAQQSMRTVPVLVSVRNVDDLLEEHDRQIQETTERMIREKKRASKFKP